MVFHQVTATFKKFHNGVVGKKDWFPKLIYFAVYIVLSSFFAVHLYFVISEYLTKMFVDITSFKKLEDYAPDVAICFNRPYVAHKMDLQANYFGYFPRRINRCRNMKYHVLSLRSRKVPWKFARFDETQNILEEEVKSLKSFEDILVRCQSRGYKCGPEHFEVFPRYIRHSRICVIFKAKAFFRKISSFGKNDRRSQSKETFLSIFLRHNWLTSASYQRRRNSMQYERIKMGLRVYLLDTGAALLSSSRRVTSTKLVKYDSVSPGTWNDITFSLAVTNRSASQCSTSATGFEIADEVANRTHKFPYLPDLCRVMGMQSAVRKKCGCYDIKLPLSSSDKNVTFCQKIPPIFQQARSFSFDCQNKTISLYDARREIVGEEPFKSEAFKNIFCAKRNKGSVFSDIKCPVACHKTKGEILESSSASLDREAIDEEFYNDTEEVDIPDAKFGKYVVIRVLPSSWKIPVTKMEEVYPLSKLLSDLGGILGMWLGASMVGLIELLLSLRRKIISRNSKITSQSFPDGDSEFGIKSKA